MTDSPHTGYRPIADYGFLSDCHSTALVSLEGSIDWACLRRFDAPSTFARILDTERGGFFSIRPVEPIVHAERRYRPGTMVLETILSTHAGSIRCTDAFAMAVGGASQTHSELLRVVEVLGGRVEVEIVVEPRFDYGATRPWLRRHEDGHYTAVGGSEAIIIESVSPLTVDRDRCRLSGRLDLSAGDKVAISVLSIPAHLVDTHPDRMGDVEDRLAQTVDWWTAWSTRTEADGEYRDLLDRSALVLKGLTCAPTGAVIAAPTTSLPEIPGGGSNWDYRYSWVRDSTMALSALAAVGHQEVARGFRDFIMRSAAGHGADLQIMYGPYGERLLPEIELDLYGWRGSRPVRSGNGAASQTQLDVYGQLLDAAHLWHKRGAAIDEDEWQFLSSIVDEAESRRGSTDSGIWELRGPTRHYVHSKVMIWVALDRGVRFVEDHGFAHASVDRWRAAREEVRRDVETLGVGASGQHFVQYYGTDDLDASLLKLPLVGFIAADDDRMRHTTDLIIDQLGVPPSGFLRRFRNETVETVEQAKGGAEEGVFLLCSFWLVEVLALQGRIDEAEKLFADLAATGNDLGLFAEEYDVGTQEFLGNFPQAFTHLGLISAYQRLRSARP